MKKIFAAALVLAVGIVIGVGYTVSADTVYQPSALFDTQLATTIANSPSTTSFTLQKGTDGDGNALTGNMCFTVDGGLSNVEYICGSVSGTVVSNLVRGVSFTDGVTSVTSHLQSHRIGADVKVTDFPYLSQITRVLNGVGTLPNYLNYASSISIISAPTSSYALPNWGQVTSYVNSVATSGAPDASQSSKGIVQIATPSQIASGTATSTDGAQTLWNVVSAGQYGKSYGATPTVTTQNYGAATGTASTTFVYNYTGINGSFTIPALGVPQTNGHSPSAAISMTATLTSSNGGNSLVNNYTGGLGRSITANLSTTTFSLGTTVYYSVSSAGASSGDTITSVSGGYADGQNSPTSGSSYVGGGGGGSTWISTTNGIGSAQLVACGGGGAGGQTGLNGGNGGGGSCPANGGAPYSNGGVGSYLSTGATNISTSTVSGNGSITVVYTYSYNDPTENVSSTVSGNNFGGTVTVSAATAHLSPTTSTINFAPWNFPVTGVSCTANTWASSLAPFILAKNTTSVEFGFGSTIAGNKYDYQCNAY